MVSGRASAVVAATDPQACSQRNVRSATSRPTASHASRLRRSGQIAPGPWPKMSACRMPSSRRASGKALASDHDGLDRDQDQPGQDLPGEERPRDAGQERLDPDCLDVGDRLAVDPVAPLVPLHQLPRPLQHIRAVELVPQRVEPAISICLGCTVEGALQFSDRLVGHRLPFRDWRRPVAALASTAEAGSLCSGRVVLSHPSTLVRSPPTPPTPIPRHFGGRLIGGVTRLEIRPGGVGVSRVTPRNCPCMPPLRRRGAGGRACACCRRTPRGSLRR
jgi:hypothetical protein